MSYGLRFNSIVKDGSGNQYTVNIHKRNYVGSVTNIHHYDPSPLMLQYRGGRGDYEDGKSIFPSSLSFSIVSKEEDDFNELLESEYKQFHVEVKRLNSTNPDYSFVNSTGATSLGQDGSIRSWTMTGTTAEVFLNDANKLSNYLYSNVNNVTNCRFIIKQIESNSPVPPIRIRVDLLDSGSNVVHTQSIVLLTSARQDITVTYTGTTPVQRIQLQAIRENVLPSGIASRIRFYGGIEYQQAGEILYWKGWLQPENLSKSFTQKQYTLFLDFGDGLLDTKDIDFPVQAASGHTSIVKILKAGLDETGIQLPISDQLNITEKHFLYSTSTVLNSIYANTNRFIDNEDGVTKYLNIYETLERLLKSFNCKLSQVEGKWTIQAKNERIADKHYYSEDTLSVRTDIDYNRTVDITNYKIIFGTDEQSKIAPLKEFNTTFATRFLGENLVLNGNFADGLTGWSNGTGSTAFYTFSNVDNQLSVLTREPFVHSEHDVRHTFTSAPFSLEMIGTGDTLTVNIDAVVTSIAFEHPDDNPSYPHIQITLKYPNGATAVSPQFSTAFRLSDVFKTYTHSFPINQNGDYQLSFSIVPSVNARDDYDHAYLLFDNVIAMAVYDDETEITYDKYYRIINTGSTAIQKGDSTIYFSDSGNIGDVGALKYSSTGLTSSWTSHDGILTDVPLVELLSYLKLQERSRFKDFVRLTLLKSDRSINFNTILKIGSKYYDIVSFYHDLRKEYLDLELVEHLNPNLSNQYKFSQYQLNTVDGKSSSGGGSGNSGGGSVDLSNYYTKPETNTLLDTKVNTSTFNTYTSTTNSRLNAVESDISTIESDISAIESALDNTIQSIGTINSNTKHSNGASISSGELILQTADDTNPGLVSTGSQTFTGNKGFSNFVGVNNPSPLRILHIKQDGSYVNDYSTVALENSSTINNTTSRISYRTTTTGLGGASFVEYGAIEHKYIDHANLNRTSELAFYISDAGSFLKKVRINGAGLIADRLTVSGSSSSTIEQVLSRTGGAASTWSIRLPEGSNELRFYNGGDDRFKFSTAGVGSAVNWSSTSDMRLKTNISPVPSQLDKVKAISELVVNFNWKDTNIKDTGFIAQELLKVAPEFVNVPEESDGMLSIHYGKMVSPLYSVVGELLNEIEVLKQEITALKNSKTNGTT